ncbi:Hypothetical protein, predicted transmembrane protein [Mesomycoplasma ovipneumoniae 14811]|uniref:Uncharacterized protein n=1 Tax=Mesomycoplasma ovipneumoniae 14811 TaxID=1188239 RepID=A0A014MIM0_9BACT|nr:Hypothetical protein, predicted transmembrane protein [Mesomycoplasma ovipneumoniae 14811]
MNFWSRAEKFLNLKIPKKISIIPILSNLVYFWLFYYLVYRLNPKKKRRHYFFLVLLYLISYPFPFFVLVSALSLTHNGDFLRFFYLKIFNKYFLMHLFEIITYLIFYFPYSYVCSFLQKIFSFYLTKKVKQNLGQLNPENKFDFLTNFDYDKYYKFACKRELYDRYFEQQNWYNPDQNVENIIKSIKNYNWYTEGYVARYYSHIILQIFLFNSENSELKINQKNWKYFLIIYFIFTTLHFIFSWYSIWLFFGYGLWSELNTEDLYKELFESGVVFLIALMFAGMGFTFIPRLFYHPKTWVTYWLFES